MLSSCWSLGYNQEMEVGTAERTRKLQVPAYEMKIRESRRLEASAHTILRPESGKKSL